MQSHIVRLSAYAKLPKVVVLDSEDTDWCMQEADIVSHQLQGQMLIEGKNEFISSSAVLSEDVANMIIPLRLITGSDHTPGFWCKKWLVIQRQESSTNGWMRLQSYKTKSKALVKSDTKTFFVSRVVTENADVTCENKRSPPPLWWRHTETQFEKDKWYNILIDPLRFVLLLLGIHEWEVPTTLPHSAAVTSSSYTSWLHRWHQQWEQLQ